MMGSNTEKQGKTQAYTNSRQRVTGPRDEQDSSVKTEAFLGEDGLPSAAGSEAGRGASQPLSCRAGPRWRPLCPHGPHVQRQRQDSPGQGSASHSVFLQGTCTWTLLFLVSPQKPT